MAFSTGATDLEGGVKFRFSNGNQASWQANKLVLVFHQDLLKFNILR